MNSLASLRPRVARALAVVSLIAAATLVAAGPAHGEPIAQLKRFVAASKTAKGEFSQRIVKSSGQVGNASSGAFSFQRPGQFRWEVQKPYAQLIVSDGQTLSIFDPDLNQATVRKLGNALGSTPAAILFGSGDLEEAFTLNAAAERDGIEWLEAVPKDRDSGFERIGIGMRDGQPAAMELRDAFGQTTLITFTHIERAPVFNAETFKFAPPKGADVIRQYD